MGGELRYIFDKLNEGCPYIVLRNWENVLNDEAYINTEEDIDILCQDKEYVINLLGASRIHKNKKRDNFFVPVGSKRVRLDIRWIGDGYYPKNWEIKMLENRQKSTVGVYIPNREDHLFSLLYHALLQKPSLSDKYYIAINNLYRIFKQGLLQEMSEQELLSLLYNYLQSKSYKPTIPHDPGVILNPNNIRPPYMALRRHVLLLRYCSYFKSLICR